MYRVKTLIGTDIDECSTMTDNCNDNAACTNTEGSFMCICNAGYTGDGVMCVGMDFDKTCINF